MSKAISVSTGPIFTIFFTKMKIICVNFLISFSFSDSSRDVAMATNYVSYRTCSLGAKVSQDPLDRFSQSLHRVVGIELQMTFFFRYLKGRCHGNQFSGIMTGGRNGRFLLSRDQLALQDVREAWRG